MAMHGGSFGCRLRHQRVIGWKLLAPVSRQMQRPVSVYAAGIA